VQIYEIRGILAGLATKKFVEAASARDVSKVMRIFERIKAAAKQEDIRAVLSGVSEFHNEILNLIDNEPLRGMLDRIHTRVAILRVTTLSSPGRLPYTIRELASVFKAIEARDGAAAEKAFIAHIGCVAKVARAELIRQNAEHATPKPMKRRATNEVAK
jgi:DNA-binding GntR family transcriptional regulator